MLDPIEARILGSLLEKEQATPEYYPMTVNAVVLAANQKSNRHPVLDLGEPEVARALERLQDRKLVWKIMGGRAVRWQHNADAAWQLDRGAKSILTLLLLRGPQTAGELRSRAERLHRFESTEDVEAALRQMAAGPEPLAEELPRQPGQKEPRWRDLVSERTAGEATADAAPVAAGSSLVGRLENLEQNVDALALEIRRLRDLLGE